MTGVFASREGAVVADVLLFRTRLVPLGMTGELVPVALLSLGTGVAFLLSSRAHASAVVALVI